MELILVGFVSFMTSPEQTAGSVQSSDDDKRKFARESHAVNAANPHFARLFPQLIKK